MPYQTVVLADNPVGYWQLDETTGITANNIGSLGAPGMTGGYPDAPNPDGWDVHAYLRQTPKLFLAARERLGHDVELPARHRENRPGVERVRAHVAHSFAREPAWGVTRIDWAA